MKPCSDKVQMSIIIIIISSERRPMLDRPSPASVPLASSGFPRFSRAHPSTICSVLPTQHLMILLWNYFKYYLSVEMSLYWELSIISILIILLWSFCHNIHKLSVVVNVISCAPVSLILWKHVSQIGYV